MLSRLIALAPMPYPAFAVIGNTLGLRVVSANNVDPDNWSEEVVRCHTTLKYHRHIIPLIRLSFTSEYLAINALLTEVAPSPPRSGQAGHTSL